MTNKPTEVENQAPDKLYWVRTSFGASAHDVRVHPEDIEYARVCATPVGELTVKDALAELLMICPNEDWSVKRQEYIRTGNQKSPFVSWEIHNHSRRVGFSAEPTIAKALEHVRAWNAERQPQ